MEEAGQFSLTQNAGLVGLSKFVNILALLAASMTLTRVFTRSAYGSYEQVWLIYNSFLPLAGYGLSSALYFFSAREEKRAVYSAAIIVSSAIGLLAGIVLAVFAPIFARWFDAPSLTVYIRVLAVYTLLASPSLMFESVFVTERKVGLLLLGNVILAVLLAGSIFVSAVIFHDLFIVFVCIAAVGAAKSAFLIVYMLKARRFARRKLSPLMKTQLLYALPIIVSSIAGTISKQVDRYLVSLLMTPGKFAIYAIGSKELPLIAVITGSASAILFPVFSELGTTDGREKFIEIWRNSISKTGFFLLPLMIFLLFVARDFMGFFFGEKYVVSAAVFRIFLLLLPLRLAFYSQALFSLGKQRLYMYTSIAEMLLSGTASYFLLRSYGLEGAAFGKVMVTYIEVFVLVGVLAVTLKANVMEMFPWKKIFKLLIVSGVSLIPVLLVRGYFGNVYYRFVIESAIFASVFGGLALLTGSLHIISIKKMQFIVN